MNWLGFISLTRQIYGPGLPDPDSIQQQGLLGVNSGMVFGRGMYPVI